MDALEPAKKLFPFGMVGQNGVCPEANRGLYAARDEVLFVPEWDPFKGTRVRGFDRGSHDVEKIDRWFLQRQVFALISKGAYFSTTAYSFVQEVSSSTRDLNGRVDALRRGDTSAETPFVFSRIVKAGRRPGGNRIAYC